jgi:addiction module HigA family antidote
MSKKIVPGDVLKKELESYGISVTQFSKDIGLSASAVRQLVSSKLKISLEIALKLAKYFGKTVKYWVDLETDYRLAVLGDDAKLTAALKNIPKAKKAPAKAPAAKKPLAVAGKKPAVKARAFAAKKPLPAAGRKAAAPKKAADKQPAVKARAPRKPRTSKAVKPVPAPLGTF